MFAYLCVLDLWWTGDMSTVYAACRPMSAGIGSGPRNPDRDEKL